ncbi:hypothetical protein, partial [Glycomyces salinus]|uniref:hypothetical protein n=1 Tax=Glycomyces salinus TaxID=980294 RepID=UPI001E32AB26
SHGVPVTLPEEAHYDCLVLQGVGCNSMLGVGVGVGRVFFPENISRRSVDSQCDQFIILIDCI